LALQAPNQQIKSCIQTYDPEKPTKTNIKTLSETFRKDTIIDTLNFLSKQKPEHANKDDLVQKQVSKSKIIFQTHVRFAVPPIHSNLMTNLFFSVCHVVKKHINNVTLTC